MTSKLPFSLSNSFSTALTTGFTCSHKALLPESLWLKNLVTSSWLTDLYNIVLKPVGVTWPKLFNKEVRV